MTHLAVTQGGILTRRHLAIIKSKMVAKGWQATKLNYPTVEQIRGFDGAVMLEPDQEQHDMFRELIAIQFPVICISVRS